MKTDEIRSNFLEFFRQKGHSIVKSDSLVPTGDPTLLFTSAGMVQFKSFYLAEGDIPFSRAATSQKCFRSSDIENVGRTARHQTFFEMLGNFSFGDYFKEEAITWEWELLTKVFDLPKDELWVSYFEEDKETRDIWKNKLGLSEDRLKPFGRDNNYWPSGDAINNWVGACGPCTEIYIDYGPERGCGKPTCTVGCDCDRYEEIMNIVLPQFFHSAKGDLSPLPKRGIDMGMGLERLASILQGVPNNFEIDIMRPILDDAAQAAGVEYGGDPKTDVSLKLITDHARAVSFLIGDGVLPSNEGRGYVLRRLIRRAVRHGRLLSLEKPFLYKMVGEVAQQMKAPYPEIAGRREHISQVLLGEEQRFFQTLKNGMDLINEFLANIKGRAKGAKPTIPGDVVFKLYDTWGFPLELTQEIAAEQGVEVDKAGFDKFMDEQRVRAKSAWVGSGDEAIAPIYASLAKKLGATDFVGYEAVNSASTILALVQDGRELGSADADTNLEVILDKTPFYASSGGQVGDIGVLVNDQAKVEVLDTVKVGGKLFVHKARLIRGRIKAGDQVQAEINQSRRHAVARNHTGTHLLHAALRHVLGKHVEQSGSLVEPERLRFDFSHSGPMTETELKRVEDIVNENILKNKEVKTVETKVEEAKKLGALAFFAEKYGDKVRMVSIGQGSPSGAISMELCGGTHVKRSGDIGLIKIVSEGGVAAGVRRIEALTGEGAYQYLRKEEESLKEAAGLLKCSPHDLVGGVKRYLESYKELEKKLQQTQAKLSAGHSDDLTSQVKEVEGIKYIASRVEDMGPEALRDMADQLKVKIKSGVIVLASVGQGKVTWIAAVTSDLTKKVNASDLVKKVSAVTGGGGGGRPDFAQAGGKLVDKVPEALQKVPEFIKVNLNG